MSEFRQNMVSNEWVIIATERAKRPGDFSHGKEKKPPLPEHSPKCPFCLGNESLTPEPTFSIQQNGNWFLRVVPNKFAAVQPSQRVERHRAGKFMKMDGFGVAEVIIEHPSHNKTIATMDHQEVKNIILAYKNRYKEISYDKRINLITIFRNYGTRAGASIEHPHSQVIATPIVPPHTRAAFFQAQLAYDSHGSCIYCDLINEELSQAERIIMETDQFVALAPFASRSPFETRIYPKSHKSSFMNISEEEIEELTSVLHATLKKIYVGLDEPDYNYVIRSSPCQDGEISYYHWHIVIYPKLTTAAGFEIGTGIYINVTLPETCAEFLRNVTI